MNTYFKIIILLILPVFNLTVLAQDIKFKHLSIEDGLSQNTVYAILQDSMGFLWFGTQDGLNKYDGYRFTVYRHKPQNSQGLSHNEVFALLEDSRGVLWIGTGNGLNQYDRQQDKFIHYFHDPKNPNSLSHNHVWSIYEDNTGLLWIGTSGGGLNKFDPQTGQFTHYQHDPQNPYSLNHDTVWPLYQDKTGMLWIGTDGGGLNKFDPKSGKFTHYLPNPQKPDDLSNFLTSIYEDQTGTLWIGSFGGLHQFDRQSESFSHYFSEPKNPHSLSYRAVWAITEDGMGNLWVGTDGGGLNQFDRQTGHFLHHQHKPLYPTSLNNDHIFSLYQDRAGTVWVGTNGGGLNQFNRAQEKFNHYFPVPNNPNTLNNKDVFAIYEDREGILWVGTETGGLNKFERQRQKVTHYLNDPENPNSLSHNEVQTIYEDSNGILWIGTYGGGLNRFNRQHNNFVSYKNNPDNPNSLSDNYVMSIHEDKKGNLWIGTRGGLNQYDRQLDKFVVRYYHSPQNPYSLSYEEVSVIYEDCTGVLWIGTPGGGLNKIDPQTETGLPGSLVRYQHDTQNPTSLSNDEILSIHEDATATLWIGTSGGGLNQFNRETQTFTHYKEEDGLANDTVYGILEDEPGYLWLSTNKGLSKFNPKTKTFRNYDVSDGLQSNEFNANACHKSRRGELFFGGINGFNAFYPLKVKDNPYIPPIAITGFKIFNQPVSFGENSPLQQPISETHAITLAYHQSFFAFEFAALNFLQPEKNQYAYKLEGFDQDWNEMGTQRNTNYTYMPHGTYQFRVKGSNNDNVWNEEGTAIQITILPPLWKTWWAYTLYVLTILAIIVSYIRAQQRKLLAKQQELEHEQQELEHEQKISAQLKEADKLKDEFLANTSHELRTPLNGIIGIAESLVDGAAGQINQQLRSNLAMIVSSGRRLFSLVNDILDFSQLKQKEINLQIKAINICTIAEMVLTQTQPLIGSKKLQLSNAIPSDLPSINADENRLQQILYNLVGNAIKFTDQGQVEISAEIANKKLAITVSDTGIGILPEKCECIFEAFEQADGGTARIYGGTGLGLAVTQQLVHLHGGKMSVQSQPGVGSQFTFSLPLSSQSVESIPQTTTKPDRFLKPVRFDTTTECEPPATTKPVRFDTTTEREPPPATKPDRFDATTECKPPPATSGLQSTEEKGEFTILVVDDDLINRQVLINHLSLHNYTIHEAASGMETLAYFENKDKPDLILLDVMMPQMNGYDVTRQIRETWQADELPIILLTAKDQMVDLVVGLESGANDYLTKPVSKEELLARIKTHVHILQLKAEAESFQKEYNQTLECLNAAYSRFVPHEFLKFFNKDSIVDINLGDQVEREMTILFTDIRDFTSISEKLTPKDNFDFINNYLGQMEPVIHEHKGIIDKYIGDAIMVLFPTNADDALKGAIAMLQTLAKYNRILQYTEFDIMRIGIGLHTGKLMLGTVGGQNRMDSTVIADAVNLASRIEGLTKIYGVPLLISEHTYMRLADPSQYNIRVIDATKVKGKSEMVTIYEVFDADTPDSIALKNETIADFEPGFVLYHSGEIADAKPLFETVLQVNPHDTVAQVYLERCQEFLSMIMPKRPVILIVDDVPINLKILFNILEQHNFKVLIAKNGKTALEIVTQKNPHLILLDVMMPSITGFEVCRRLKENTKTADIPVIFMTALSDTEAKIKGFQLGAVDYITKPFQTKEVLSRIRTHLTVYFLRQQIQAKHVKLKTQNELLKRKIDVLETRLK
jgi:DNA-binding response OmpR family regulator/signal transduction histidine kinase/ligand-binding sensor domain-containing protein/class 3 adenylate cyclase